MEEIKELSEDVFGGEFWENIFYCEYIDDYSKLSMIDSPLGLVLYSGLLLNVIFKQQELCSTMV